MDGDELKQRREALGYTVGQLAREFEVMPSSIYRWESGAVPLHGLTAVGADTVLKALERRRRSPALPAPAPGPGEGEG
jgi:transcriptional regulator with XRE-family HTH domain